MSFSNCSMAVTCSFALMLMAVTPYHRFASSLNLVSSKMTSLVFLGIFMALLARRSVTSRRCKRAQAKCFKFAGCLLAVASVVPEWADLAFYAHGDSVPLTFAPFWILRALSSIATISGSAILVYALLDMADVGQLRAQEFFADTGACGPRTAGRFDALLFLSALMFCCRSSWRIVPSPWRGPSSLALSVGTAYLFPLSMVLILVLFLFRRHSASDSDSGAADAVLVLPSMFLGIVPSMVLTYFANDGAIAASLLMGSALVIAELARLLARRASACDEGQTTIDVLDADLFSPPLSPREEQFVRLLLKGKTPAEIAVMTNTKAPTVRTTLHRAYRKASVNGARELVALFEDGRGSAGSQQGIRLDRRVRTRQDLVRACFRVLFAVFLAVLAVSPLVVAAGDWGAGIPWMAVLSLGSYCMGLALLLTESSSHEKVFVDTAIVRPPKIEGTAAWAVFSALECSFSYAVSWRCVRDVFMGTPILLCGIAVAVPLVVEVCRLERRVRKRTIIALVGVAVLLGLVSVDRGRIPTFSVLIGILLIFAVLGDRRWLKTLATWMTCFGLLTPVWISVFNGVQDLMVFEPQFLVSVLGSSSALNIVVATIVVCWSALMCATHVLFMRSLEDEMAVDKYRADESDDSARERRFALLKSRALSDVQAEILLKTAEGASTGEIADDVGYSASTVQALRSASYRQLGIKDKVELVLLLSQVNSL